MGTHYISVIGPSRCRPEEYEEARETGRLVALRGAILVSGGLGGVMEAAARGAKEAGGRTIGILHGHDRGAANHFLDCAVTTGLGEARNLAVVSSGDVVIAVGGGYGTLSEMGLAAKIGRPLVILHGWEITGIEASAVVRRASSPQEAVDLAFALLEEPTAEALEAGEEKSAIHSTDPHHA